MARVRFHKIIEGIVGKMGYYIYRRSHNGQISVFESPFMKGLKIKWSQAQKDHRQQIGEASHYASAAVADPDLRPLYVQMALERGKNPKRPFDMAVSDYYHNRNDLLWKKHMGEQEKPQNWDMDRYHFYLTRQTPQGRLRVYKRKRRR
jgi:hypothetical protein